MIYQNLPLTIIYDLYMYSYITSMKRLDLVNTSVRLGTFLFTATHIVTELRCQPQSHQKWILTAQVFYIEKPKNQSWWFVYVVERQGAEQWAEMGRG